MGFAAAYVGCAGWSLPRGAHDDFPREGTHLQRYAARLNACEINSSFYRAHSAATYRRWADSTPDAFRFCVKLPKAITHERKLVACESLLDEFVGQSQGLGTRLGCLLVQLPPGLAFETEVAHRFLAALRQRWAGPVAVEPRHASWFTPHADALLAGQHAARVLADPVRHAPGAWPGGWQSLVYLRLHGSPRMYYSAYEPALIAALARRIAASSRAGCTVWCMFDNTAAGAAARNALDLRRALHAQFE